MNQMPLARTLAIAVLGLLTSSLHADKVLAAAVGRTEASYGVTQNGGVTYSIPIRITEGINGLTPSLAISYTGPGTRSILGVGFALAGISYITPCRKTIAQDLNAAPVTLTSADRYCLDGARLRSIGTGTYGATGTQYRTELDQMVRVTSFNSTNNIPGYFRVELPNGLEYEYGNTTDSKLLASGAGGAPPQFWAVNKISDTSSNSISFTYDTNNSLRRFRPLQIQYTTSNGGPARYKVAFVYQTSVLPEPFRFFTPSAAGGAAKDDDKLLDRVELSLDSTVYRKYLLTYAPGAGTNKRLNTVQECAPVAGYPDDCFPATTLGWQSATSGHSTPTPSSPVANGVIPMDINNDGFQDLVWAASGIWRYMLGGPAGFGPMVYTNVTATNSSKAMPLDWNADGFWDLLIDWSDGKWRVLTGSVSGLSTSPVHAGPGAGIPSNAANTSWTVADANNDGRDDLFSMQLGAGFAIYIRLNSSTGFGASTQAIVDTEVMHTLSQGFIKRNGTSSFTRPDFNGDGRTDLLIYGCYWDSEEPSHCIFTAWFQLVSNGSSYVNVGPLPSAAFNIEIRYGDFNSDGLTDVVYPASTGVWKVGFGQGSGSFSIVNGPSTSGYATYQTLIGDYDGDGYDDLYLTTNSPWQWSVLRSTGTALASTPLSTGIVGDGLGWMLVDQTGDGLPDLGRYDTATLVWSTYGHSGLPGERFTSSIDGLGNAVAFSYLPMTGTAIYTPGPLPVYPDRKFMSTIPLVSSMELSPGGGQSYSYTYTYADARLHVQGRSYLGMGMRTIVDERNDSSVIQTFKQGFPLVGALQWEKTYQPGIEGMISHQLNGYNHHVLSSIPGNERFLPFLSSSNLKLYEVDGPKNALLISEIDQTRTVNTLGNLTASYTTVTDRDSSSDEFGMSYQIQNLTSYLEDQTNWCISAPVSRSDSRSLPSGTQETRTTTWTVTGSNCRVTQEIVEPNQLSDISLTTDIGYDSCGNVSLVSSYPTTQINLKRDTAIAYGSCHFPTSITNAEGHVTQMTFEATHGGVKTVTDPNQLTSTTYYDSFGRANRVLRPDGTATRTTLMACSASDNWCGKNSSARVKVTRTERNTVDGILRTDEVILDGMGRIRWLHKDSLNSGPAIVEILYDEFGRPVQRWHPRFAGGLMYRTDYAFDVIDRITQINEPIDESQTTGRITQFAYEGRDIRVTDPKLIQTTRRSSVLGQMRKVIDPSPGGTTSYTYRPFGELATITDASGNVSSWSYNLRGFLTGTFDPDNGNWIYEPNAFGEIAKIRDAKTLAPAFTTEFEFDKLSRLKKRTDVPEAGVTVWTWGNSAAAKNIGQLESITSPGNYSEGYTFDALGRLSQQRVTADGTSDYFDLTYQSQTGLLDTLQYPTSTSGYRLKLGYTYSSNLLQQVRDFNGSTVFWQANSADAWGHIQDELFGNGVVAITDFDQASGLLATREAGIGGGTGLINSAVHWDLNKNLERRSDSKLIPAVTEVFEYDSLNRLDRSTRNSAENLNVDFSAIGNITSKGGQTFTYTGAQAGCSYYAHTQPRAVRKIGSTVYCYDANGNMIKRAGSTITYASYNLPIVINSGTNSSTISYGAHRNRYKQVAVSGGSTETTVYVAGLLEKVTRGSLVEYRHLIQGGQGVAGIHTRRTGGNPGSDTVYVHMDHLGSPELFTSASGGVVVRPSFGAYGERRDGSDWNGPVSAADLTAIANTIRHGFTGHEHLDAVGLIHMNGRVYDPLAGRFLGVDPIVHLGQSQSPNGYSYVWNNPLTFTDPSGFDHCDDPDITVDCDHIFIPQPDPWWLFPVEDDGRRLPDMSHTYISNETSLDEPRDYSAEQGQPMPTAAGIVAVTTPQGNPSVLERVLSPAEQLLSQVFGNLFGPGENDCGPEGVFQVPNTYGKTDINATCTGHDICYDESGVSRASCNEAFKRDIIKAFKDQGGNPFIGFVVADTYFAAVTVFGGPAYDARQAPQMPRMAVPNGFDWSKLHPARR